MEELEFYNGQRSGEEIDELAVQSDLASIHATGSTNATGATIAAGTYFYLDGVLSYAKSNIANGASFTSSNSEAVNDGGLNRLSEQNKVSNFPTGTTSLVALYSSIKRGERKTFYADNATILTLTDWPSTFSDYKFCAFIEVTCAPSVARYVYNVLAVSGSGVPKTASAYPLSGSLIWSS